MEDTTDTEDVESYVLSSTYRSHVLEHLAGSVRATPKEIADSADVPRPHISRALSELRDKEVVELRVSESRTVGRYYGLTEKGEQAWPEIKRAIRDVEWAFDDPSTPGMRSVVELAKDEFGERLRCVGRYDGDEVTICYLDSEVRSGYSDEEFEKGIRTLVFDHSLDEVGMPDDDCWSEVLHFTDFSILHVRVEDGSRVALSFDRDESVPVPTFAESIRSLFEG